MLNFCLQIYNIFVFLLFKYTLLLVVVATSKIHLISTDFFFSITLILEAIKHKGASFQSPRKFFLRQYGPP